MKKPFVTDGSATEVSETNREKDVVMVESTCGNVQRASSQEFQPRLDCWGLPEYRQPPHVDPSAQPAQQRSLSHALARATSVSVGPVNIAKLDDIRDGLHRLAAAQAASFIKSMRESVSLTQEELAARLNVSRRWIAALESGSRRGAPSLTTLYRVAAACNQRVALTSVMKE